MLRLDGVLHRNAIKLFDFGYHVTIVDYMLCMIK